MSTGNRAVCVGWGTLLQAEETGQLPKKERHQTPGPPPKEVDTRAAMGEHQGIDAGAGPVALSLPAPTSKG